MDFVLFQDEDGKEQRANLTKFTQKTDNIQSRRNKLLEYPLHVAKNDELHEIVVPTTSYRMGVPEIAMGLALIDLNQSHHKASFWYTNLWLPGRFDLLFIYIAALICALVLFVIGKVQQCRRNSRKYSAGGSWKRRHSSSSSQSPRNRRGKHSRSSSREKLRYSKLV